MNMTSFPSITLVQESCDPIRIDRFLALEFPQFSRQYFQDLIEREGVLVNSKPALKKFFLLKPGDTISFAHPSIFSKENDKENILSEHIQFQDLYEDDHILIINKPAGMTVHPGAGNYTGTVANGLLFRFTSLQSSDSSRPGIVHRLDKDTSGVLLTAKTDEAVFLFSKLFSDRLIKKTYLAITSGYPKLSAMTINAPIARHPVKRKEMQISPLKGKSAETHCHLLATSAHLGFLKLSPITGRTHQLRVHLKHAGIPILGDSVYGMISTNRRFKTNRQLLHASTLEFIHPITKELILIKSPLPGDMRAMLTTHFGNFSCEF